MTVYASLNRDPQLVKDIGAATALEVRATGIPYTFAPCVAVNILLITRFKFPLVKLCF